MAEAARTIAIAPTTILTDAAVVADLYIKKHFPLASMDIQQELAMPYSFWKKVIAIAMNIGQAIAQHAENLILLERIQIMQRKAADKQVELQAAGVSLSMPNLDLLAQQHDNAQNLGQAALAALKALQEKLDQLSHNIHETIQQGIVDIQKTFQDMGIPESKPEELEKTFCQLISVTQAIRQLENSRDLSRKERKEKSTILLADKERSMLSLISQAPEAKQKEARTKITKIIDVCANSISAFIDELTQLKEKFNAFKRSDQAAMTETQQLLDHMEELPLAIQRAEGALAAKMYEQQSAKLPKPSA